MNPTHEPLLRHYLTALNARDLAGCLRIFTPDARLTIRGQEHTGLAALTAWHQERFQSGFQALDPVNYRHANGEASIDFDITSNRFAGRRLEKLPATIVVSVSGEQFAAAQFKLRIGAGLMKLFGGF